MTCHTMWLLCLKAMLWAAVLLLPGGLLLVPVIYAMRRRDARPRVRGAR